jgi:hypothetical protein
MLYVRGNREQYPVDAKDTAEVRHWITNNLDLSKDWEISDYKEICTFEDEEDYEYDFENMVDCIEGLFEFPVKLIAENSNWRGQTGEAYGDTAEDVVSKSLSFGNDSLSLRKNDQGYYFRTSSHDVPCGFNIYIETA